MRLGVRLAAGLVVAASALVLTVPATASAAGSSVRTIAPGSERSSSPFHWSWYQDCSASGGAYGYGYAYIRAYMEEHLNSGTARFRMAWKAQIFHSGRWNTVGTARDQASIPNNSSSWSYGPITRQHDFHPSWNGYFGRLQVTLQWLNGGGGVIYRKTINSCSAQV